jgi:5-methylthioadenosine/S-adenosylhomocysteine deaminase
MFDEMRLAATLQAVRCGAGRLQARDVLAMATREGAAALGLQSEIGSVEPGKRADLILVRRQGAHLAPDVSPYSTLVYAARSTDVRTVMVDGEILVRDGRLTRCDIAELSVVARQEASALAARAGL